MEDKQSGSPPDTQGSAPKKAELERKTPREWALLTGNGPKATPGVEWSGSAMAGMSRPMGSVEHEVASTLHGWREHEHHANEPILLTREDYLAALAETHPRDEYAVDAEGNAQRDRDGNPVIKKHAGNPKPHAPALSPHKGAGVRVRLDKSGKKITERAEKSE